MLRIERLLPGELDGTLDPRDYGFEIIRDEKPQDELILDMAAFYRRTRARSGMAIPQLEYLLQLQPYDSAPAQELQARHDALEYPYRFEFGTHEFEIDEGVFCPTLTSASPFLFDVLVSAREFRLGQHAHVLDAFAGSGFFGVIAASAGAEVISFDTLPAAVACAEKNARINNVGRQVQVRHGILAEAVAPTETFDLIIANPPLVPGEPTNPLETALFDPNLRATKDFVAALSGLLAKDGRCYLLTSDVIERKGFGLDIGDLCRESGLKERIVAQLHKEYETYRVHRIERRSVFLRSLLEKVFDRRME